MRCNEDEASSESTDVIKMKPHLNQQMTFCVPPDPIGPKNHICKHWGLVTFRSPVARVLRGAGYCSHRQRDCRTHPVCLNKTIIYTCNLQEILPLNLGNIFGAEDTRPIPKWENIIQETLNRV
ncbi:hypothetical protein JHK82_055686 [Glycine max]|nr:hypothetical protein JHK82_055686 [Glycine max]